MKRSIPIKSSPTSCSYQARWRPALWLSLAVGLAMGSATQAASNSDDFNDNSRNTAKWGADTVIRQGVFTEKNQRLEYTVGSGTVEDDAWRPWILTRFPYQADWELQFDIFNSSTPGNILQLNSIGVLILTTRTNSPDLIAELYSSALGGLPSRTGFFTELDMETTPNVVVDREGGFGVTNGAIRVAFTSATKVVTVSYDIDVTDGYQWVEQATFGLAGSGGAHGNASWGLTDQDQFSISIYGYSVGMSISSGQLYVDNFMETGGVTPSGQPWPDPLGTYEFKFPSNNPLLTRMVNVTGSYQGISPTRFQRPYSIDVAQDESGKLSALGTVDGIQNKEGGSELSGLIGSVRTVNSEPQAQIKGSFSGSRDGAITTVKGSAAVPVELVDVGGGTNGISGTGSYSSKVAGVPFSGKNLPLQIDAPPGASNNLRQDWSLHLNLEKKQVGTKQRTVASAQLLLPNGDTLAFREKAVRYSATKGYTLSLTRGTNITANPVRIDKRSSLIIKSLTFAKQGDSWEPTGGVIQYRFLGQRGTANLLDFERD